jgi:hypothetical protein
MLEEPFYGFYLLSLNKIWDVRVGTAGVCKNGINYQLMISESFWDTLSEDHKTGLLKHELLHIAFGHLLTFTKFSNKELANIAMDMEINQYIDEDRLPKGGININDYGDLNLRRKAGTQYYYEELEKAQKKKKEQGSSGDSNMDKLLDGLDQSQEVVLIGPADSDDGEGGLGSKREVKIPKHNWEEFENLPEAEKQLIDMQLQRVLEQCKKQTEKKQGHVPGEMKGLIKINLLNLIGRIISDDLLALALKYLLKKFVEKKTLSFLICLV